MKALSRWLQHDLHRSPLDSSKPDSAFHAPDRAGKVVQRLLLEQCMYILWTLGKPHISLGSVQVAEVVIGRSTAAWRHHHKCGVAHDAKDNAVQNACVRM